jgi:hypothetical protein
MAALNLAFLSYLSANLPDPDGDPGVTPIRDGSAGLAPRPNDAGHYDDLGTLALR